VEDRPSLVVLPFVDFAARDAADDALALGLTDEVTDALTRLPGFFVTARHSAMSYAGAVDVRRVAVELGVRYLIEGSLLHDAASLRINFRLIDGRSGAYMWSGTHEGPLTGLMQLRDTVVREIAGRLLPELQQAEMQRALDRVPADLDAWGWLQRAQAALALPVRQVALDRALEPLRRALEIDRGYGMAHALAAAVRTSRSTSRMFPETDSDRRLARAHMAEALALDGRNPFVLAHCGEAALYSAGDIDGANALLEEALGRNPSDPSAVAMTGNARRFAGLDANESLALLRRAMRLSPRDPRSYNWEHYSNWCHWRLGDYEAMEAAARRSLELYSGYPWSWLSLVCALGLQGRKPEAARAAAAMLEILPQFSAAAFFETARGFYGWRFAGAVEASYTQLRGILDEAVSETRNGGKGGEDRAAR
jgi:TolB-like protein